MLTTTIDGQNCNILSIQKDGLDFWITYLDSAGNIKLKRDFQNILSVTSATVNNSVSTSLRCTNLPNLKSEIELAKSGISSGRPIVWIGTSIDRGEQSGSPSSMQGLYNSPRRLGDLIMARTGIHCGESIFQQGNYPESFDSLRFSRGSFVAGSVGLGGGSFVATSSATMIFTPAPFGGNYTIIDILYQRISNGGTFDLIQNGATHLSNFSTSGSDLNTKITVSGMNVSSHPVSLTWKSGTVSINGIILRRGNGIFIMNAARGGADTKYYNQDGNIYTPLNQLNSLNPVCTIINLAVNDWRLHGFDSSYSVDNYITRLSSIVDKAKLTGDVIILTGTPTGANGEPDATVQQQYVDAAIGVANNKGCRYVDTWRRWNGVYNGGPTGSMNGDKIHITAIGHDDIARAVLDCIAS